LLTLTVDPEDLGRVIGKRGATAQSLRTLLRALGTKNEARYNLKIVDNGVPREERQSNRDQSEDSSSGWASTPTANSDDNFSSSSDDDSDATQVSAAQDAANDSGEEESAVARTRRELEDLDDLDV
jgi:hypothetical protein